jgi:hypothetical protein
MARPRYIWAVSAELEQGNDRGRGANILMTSDELEQGKMIVGEARTYS